MAPLAKTWKLNYSGRISQLTLLVAGTVVRFVCLKSWNSFGVIKNGVFNMSGVWAKTKQRNKISLPKESRTRDILYT